jgi:NucS shadow ORF
MSLDVSPELIEQAERGEVDNEEFVRTVARSLPYAWQIMSRVAEQLNGGQTDGRGFADDATPPSTEEERGQLLRALASNAIREAVGRHFGVTFAFQNCHRVAAFAPSAAGGEVHRRFTSARSQIPNQQPAFRDC